MNKATFVCLDCETTGLDTENDGIIEIALAVFRDWTIIDSFESVIKPHISIPEESTAIHGITNDMVEGKPSLSHFMPEIAEKLSKGIIVGHNIAFDIKILENNSIRCGTHWVNKHPTIDTLRLARFYGGAKVNSLKNLCDHFDIDIREHHRAMSDVESTIQLFRELSRPFNTVCKLQERLSHPIEIKTMPLGKYKGCPIKDIPIRYLKWAIEKNFDQDLHFSIAKELKRRKRMGIEQSANPFLNL